jgi:DNA-binding NarL/FixJ family response regulator
MVMSQDYKPQLHGSWEGNIFLMKDETQNGTTKPRVLLADDHSGMIETVFRLLESEFEIVAAVGDGVQAVDAAVRLEPDLVVLDIGMPRLDGFRAAQQLAQIGNDAKIIFFSIHDDQDYVSTALKVGASGYVLKSRMQTDLIKAIKEALQGGVFVSSGS